MKSISKMIAAASATALTAVVLVAFAAPATAAQAEFCASDSSVKGCFATLEQCNASVSGLGGSCKRDPNYKDPSSSQAYQPKQAGARAK
jgi:Protein of unknown function (DUF3551)